MFLDLGPVLSLRSLAGCHAAIKSCLVVNFRPIRLLSKAIFALELVNISHCTTGWISNTSPFFYQLLIFHLGHLRIVHHNPTFTHHIWGDAKGPVPVLSNLCRSPPCFIMGLKTSFFPWNQQCLIVLKIAAFLQPTEPVYTGLYVLYSEMHLHYYAFQVLCYVNQILCSALPSIRHSLSQAAYSAIISTLRSPVLFSQAITLTDSVNRAAQSRTDIWSWCFCWTSLGVSFLLWYTFVHVDKL